MNLNRLFVEGNLPNPLSDLETTKHYREMKVGDNNARDIIILHNIRLAISIAREFLHTGYDLYELTDVGLEGFIKNINEYDEARNVKFSTFAAKHMKHAILSFLNKEQKIKTVSYEETIGRYKTEEEYGIIEGIYDEKCDYYNDLELEEQRDTMLEILEEFPYRKREIVKLYYGFYGRCYTKTEIAKIFGVSRQGIADSLNKTLKKIGEMFKKQKMENIDQSIDDPKEVSIKDDEVLKAIHDKIAEMSSKKMEVLLLCFSDSGNNAYTYQEIAEKLGTSYDHVAQWRSFLLTKVEKDNNWKIFDKRIDYYLEDSFQNRIYKTKL